MKSIHVTTPWPFLIWCTLVSTACSTDHNTVNARGSAEGGESNQGGEQAEAGASGLGQAGVDQGGRTGTSQGGAAQAGGDAGAAGATCPPLPSCNWCAGEEQFDSNGCVTGWLCANGKDPCVTSPCEEESSDTGCESNEYCKDELCWPNVGVGGASGTGGTSGVGGAAQGGAAQGGAAQGGAAQGGAAQGGAAQGGAAQGGAAQGGGDAGAAGAACPPLPACNWCGGEDQVDSDGCVTGWLCANGKDPCVTDPCEEGSTEAGCEPDEFCQNELCWPLVGVGGAGGAGGESGLGGAGGSGGAEECPVTLAWCNWCQGVKLFDATGCPTQWICANGVDPCLTNPCTSDEDCPSEHECGEDNLCWPSVADCKDPVLTAQYPACNTTADQATCETLGGTWVAAGGGPDQRCVCPTGDGGCPCTDTSQCTTLCVAEVPDADCEQTTEGTCRGNSTLGCACYLSDGVASLLCVD